MAQLKLRKGDSAGLATTPVIEGQLLFTTDEGCIYLDIAGTKESPGSQSSRLQLYKTSLDKVNTAISTLTSLVGSQSVSDAITNKIAELDFTDTAVNGQFITAVSETNGIISVIRKALAEADIPDLTISKITGLQTALDAKQETVVFNSTYNASTNKAATMQDVTAATAGLAGAMHFRGVSTTNPATGTATVGGVTSFAAGDVVLFGQKEYVYDGTAWHELGDESIYAVSGSITDNDIAANANIAQSKISGLTDKLAALEGTSSDTQESKSIQGAKVYAKTLVDSLDVNDAAEDNKFVTEVKQENGKIAVKRAALVIDSIEWGQIGNIT